MRFVATDGVAWHHICYINDETAMRFVAQNALVWPYCLLNKSKTTIKIPLLTIHCAFNSPCADARAVRPYTPLACKSFFNRANPKVQSSHFNVQSPQTSKFNVQSAAVVSLMEPINLSYISCKSYRGFQPKASNFAAESSSFVVGE